MLYVTFSDVATTAKAYIDTIYNMAQNAQMCKGATSEIGNFFTHFNLYLAVRSSCVFVKYTTFWVNHPEIKMGLIQQEL